MFDKLLPLITKSGELDIKELIIITKEKEDGVLIQMTSSDPDGKKMASTFAEVFVTISEMVKSQGVNVSVSHLDIDGNEK